VLAADTTVGRVADSPSAGQKLATGTTTNGRRWWRIERDGEVLWLADLRDELVDRWRQQAPPQQA